MSDAHASAHAPVLAVSAPLQPGLTAEQLVTRLAMFAGERDAAARGDLAVVVPAARLRECVQHLRDDAGLRFDTLLDIAGVDYLSFPDHRGPRFAVLYLFKSTAFRHRLRLKVLVEEESPQVPSLHDLYPVADWHERETWDQYGIVFAGHPNLKRLLNHHQFQGHPLRKDYPCQKRQKLAVNDAMVDQLEERLRAKGWEIVRPDAVNGPAAGGAP